VLTRGVITEAPVTASRDDIGAMMLRGDS